MEENERKHFRHSLGLEKVTCKFMEISSLVNVKINQNVSVCVCVAVTAMHKRN